MSCVISITGNIIISQVKNGSIKSIVVLRALYTIFNFMSQTEAGIDFDSLCSIVQVRRK